MPCKDGSRRFSDAAASQGMPRPPPKAERGKEGFPYRFQRELGPANTLIFFVVFLKIYLFIYLPASGLSHGTWDLRCSMRDLSFPRTGFSLVVALGLQSTRAQ